MTHDPIAFEDDLDATLKAAAKVVRLLETIAERADLDVDKDEDDEDK